uniref:Uncharacterized protein n=1 Tax=Globodera rostochiensis TaxID=31243 RepID=A0A914I1B5_GLORO
MIERFIRNFLNGKHNIRKLQQIQTVHVSSSNRPSHRFKLSNEYSNNGGFKLLDDYHHNRSANFQLADLGKHVVSYALGPHGSRSIRQKLGRVSHTEKAQFNM